MLFYSPLIITFLCLSFAFLYLRKAKDWWCLFIPYLICTVFTEAVGPYSTHKQIDNNYWIYNLFEPVYFSFILFILYKICMELFKIKIWMQVVSIVLIVSYLYESFTSRFKGFSVLSYFFCNISITIICCSYYYHLLKQDDYIEIKKHAPFWIIAGLLFFCFGSTISYLFFNTLAQLNVKYGLPIRQIISVILNFILYSCWGYAFLCRYRQKT